MTGKAVVAATDGSQDSQRAVAWAAREAALRCKPLVIVSVLAPLPTRASRWPADAMTGMARRSFEHALMAAAERAQAQAPAVAISTELLTGPPAGVLAQRAANAAMLVTGTRGAGGFAAMVLGSVSRYLASYAPCPVVIVREENTAVHREIVVGIRDPDESGPSASLGFAFEEAALRNARLLAVHAWYWSAQAAPAYLPHGAGQPSGPLSERLALYHDKYPAVEITQDMVRAHPGRVLAGASARADLVVLGRRDPSPSNAAGRYPHGFGSVTHAVLNHAHGSIAIVPEN